MSDAVCWEDLAGGGEGDMGERRMRDEMIE